MKDFSKVRLLYKDAYLKTLISTTIAMLVAMFSFIVWGPWSLANAIAKGYKGGVAPSHITAFIYMGLLGGPSVNLAVAAVVKKFWRLPKRFRK